MVSIRLIPLYTFPSGDVTVEWKEGYPEKMLQDFPVWRHVKTGSLYHVLGVARCSTNGEREGKENSVIYFSMTHQGLRYRDINEFLDGRFVPVPTKEDMQ